MNKTTRGLAKLDIYRKEVRKFNPPLDGNGTPLKISQYFGEYVFDFNKSDVLTKNDKEELQKIIQKKLVLSREIAEKYANAVLKWALEKGATHFTHWFQPLTGTTAEKHDAFLSFEGGQPLEKLSASELTQGEPDASSFPHGGVRSTFEARGYTTWDLTSPIFVRTNENGKTLCIPTAFVSYHGDALDIKTPLLRSISFVSKCATEFINLTSGSKREGDKATSVSVSAGIEQEYFLVDRTFYLERPDLVMAGRTLFGSLTSRNQQLNDHYFGTIPERVLAFMQEVEVELHKIGVPAKTRHNEVAPGQFEIAPIFKSANIANDNNQLVMAILQSVALRHGFQCLLHERPFSGVNGSGKHVNWSVVDSRGHNLLEPTEHPQKNLRFLAFISIILEAINRHGELFRTSISSYSNDLRLGGHEAPPTIISVFLGETLTSILEAYAEDKDYSEGVKEFLDLGADQLVRLLKDNTDRNRTSPFAFTGNKFEFRAVGSSENAGIPMTILNAAVADVIGDANTQIKAWLDEGLEINSVLVRLIKEYYTKAKRVIFNGDGYSKEWEEEAKRRNLPNLRNAVEGFNVYLDEAKTKFLVDHGVYTRRELKTRYNVYTDRFNKCSLIEFNCLIDMIKKDIIPPVIAHKKMIADAINAQKALGLLSPPELLLLKKIDGLFKELLDNFNEFKEKIDKYASLDTPTFSLKVVDDLLPHSRTIIGLCNSLEGYVSDELWNLPTYYDLLFVK